MQDPSAVLYGSFGLHIAIRTGQYGAICLLNSATSGVAPPVLLNKKIWNAYEKVISIGDLSRFWLSCFGTLVLLLITLKLFGFSIFRFWAYLMKVVPETCRAHQIWYLRFYYVNMLNNSINSNKTNNYLSLQTIEHKQVNNICA